MALNSASTTRGLSKMLQQENDSVSHPSHYNQGSVECIDAIEAATIGLDGFEAYATGNIIKYMWRWKWKNGIEDLKKAKQYIDFLIEKLSKEN